MPNAFIFKILPFLNGANLVPNGVNDYIIDLLALIESTVRHVSIKKVSAFLSD
jgi:hypothetical protein